MGVVDVYAEGDDNSSYNIDWEDVEDYEALKKALKEAVETWRSERSADHSDDEDYEQVL
jgi:hypothetical protein